MIPFRRSSAGARRAGTLSWLLPAGALALAPCVRADSADAVVVTAARHAMPALDAPAAMSVVSRREIEARGADNVLDAIRGETGISLQGRAVAGRKVLSLRGMDSRHTLFLVDGRRVGASDGVVGHSDFQYDWIAVDDIERIEIVRGPLSVLYGSEAMGGVVNVITRAVGARWRFGVSAQALDAAGGRGGDGHRAALSVAGPLAEAWTLRAGAAHARQQALAATEDARLSELEGRAKGDGWLGLAWQPAAGQRLELEHRSGAEQRWALARERGGARRFHETRNDIDRRSTSLAWDADWGAAREVATQLRAYAASIEVVNSRTHGVAINVPQTLDDRVLEGQARAALGGHEVTAGFELRNEALTDPGLPGGRSVAQHRAVFAQDEFALARGLSLTAGVRHDRHALFGAEWSPRLYAVWRAGGGWTVKGGISHGFKSPNLKQIVPGDRREGPNVFRGNPQLQPESNDAAEIALGWADGARQAQLVAFDNRVRNLIEARLVAAGSAPGTGTYVYANLLQARLRGLEAAFAQPLGAGFVTSGWATLLDAKTGTGQRLERRPRRTFTGRLDWRQGPWRAGAALEHSAGELLPSATAGQPAQPIPDLTRVSAHLVRELPAGLELTLGVDNLTNLRVADKTALVTYAEWPRTWRLTLRGQF